MATFPAALSGWQASGKRWPITSDNTLVSGSGSHADFPLAFDLGGISELQTLAQADGRDIRITDSSDNLLDYHLYSHGQSLSRGGIRLFSFNSPTAIYDSNGSGAIYWTVHPDNNSHIAHIYKWDLGTNRITHGTVNPNRDNGDDHNNAAIGQLSDGKIVVFVPSHNNSQSVLSYYISTTARDVTAWGSEQTITGFSTSPGNSYAHHARLSSESSGQAHYVVSRHATADWVLSISTNDCTSFGSLAILWDGNGTQVTPYLMMTSNGTDRIDILVSAEHANQGNQYVYHFYYDGSWRCSDGTLINGGTLPAGGIDETDLNASSTVMDLSAGSHVCWLAGFEYNSAGDPVAVIPYYPSDVAANIEYHWADFDDGGTDTWSTEKIADGGNLENTNNPYYPGGAAIDTTVAKGCYMGIGDEDACEIQHWTDTGSGWAKVLDVTSSTGTPQYRPDNVRYHPGGSVPGRITYCSGGFYDDFQTLGTSAESGLAAYPPFGGAFRGLRAKGSIATGADSTYYVYAGNSAATDGQSPSTVYANTALVMDFSGDFHDDLKEVADEEGLQPFAVEGIVEQSTALDPEVFMPQIGTNLFEASNARLTGPLIDLTSLGELTVEFFVNYTSAGSAEHAVIANLTGAGSRAGFLARLEPSNDSVEWFVDTNSGRMSGSSSASDVPANTDTYVVCTFNGDVSGAAKLYVQINDEARQEVDSEASTRTLHGTASSEVMRMFRWLTSDYFKGSVGEVKVSTVDHGEDWHKTVYNMFSTSGFWTVGTAETHTASASRPQGPLGHPFRGAFGGAI